MADDFAFVFFLQIVQGVDGIVGIHVGDDLCSFFAGQFFQIRFRIVKIGKNLGNILYAKYGVQLLTLLWRQGGQCVCQIVLMVI